MADFTPTEAQKNLISGLVKYYVDNRGPIKRQLDSLDGFISNADPLTGLIHSVKKRMKDPAHLEDKLVRKLRDAESEKQPFAINTENLFTEINDLGGYRILHLHTRQMTRINKALLEILSGEAQFTVIKGPWANVWDRESESYFQSIGIAAEYNPRMYTSVHYVVQPNSRAKVTIEIQVRTLSEELWGEVDHKFNYPHPVRSLACSEQIKVLARVASSCTRLVDSIFASHEADTAAIADPDAAAIEEQSLNAIKEAIGKRRLLGAMLENAVRWEFSNDELRIYFKQESQVVLELLSAASAKQSLASAVAEAVGHPLRISLVIDPSSRK